MLTVIAVCSGLIFGSFLGVLLTRWPRLDGALIGRSRCPHCRHALAWYALIPLASFALLGGRCRYCRVRVSALYPALETATAAALGAYAYRHGISGVWGATDLVILFGLVALFFFDLKRRILPDIIVMPLIAIVLVRTVALRSDTLAGAAATALSLVMVFGMAYVASHGRWLGLGDVKLSALIGLLFGYPTAIIVTVASVWAGALTGVGLVLVGRATMKTALPFGSFWTAVAIAALII